MTHLRHFSVWFLAVVLLTSSGMAQERFWGGVWRDRTYVQSHRRAEGEHWKNWSPRGNVSPRTRKLESTPAYSNQFTPDGDVDPALDWLRKRSVESDGDLAVIISFRLGYLVTRRLMRRYARRRTHDATEAEDLTQEFFSTLLEKEYLAVADPQRGRFRSFLLTVFKNFLANEWDKGRAQKRGGGHSPVSLDFTVGESRYVREPEDDLTPDQEGYWLEVVNTEVTYRGVSGLKRTLPSVEITVDRSSIFGDEETD